jgi:hypothetical protein
MQVRLDLVGEVRPSFCQYLVEAGFVRYVPHPLLMVEELLDDGEVLLPMAHPGRVSSA